LGSEARAIGRSCCSNTAKRSASRVGAVAVVICGARVRFAAIAIADGMVGMPDKREGTPQLTSDDFWCVGSGFDYKGQLVAQ
jgi:hypothetical protein